MIILRFVRLGLILLVFLFGLLLHFKNDQPVTFHYYTGHVDLPLSVLLVCVFCLGTILGIMAILSLVLRVKRDNARLKKQLKNYQQEIDNLRVIPLNEKH